MSILKTCCCCLSIRKGSFAVGLFTLTYYTIVVAIGAFHVNEGTHSAGLLALSFLIVLMSGLCVAASVFLLVGLSVECKQMLLPWIVVIVTTTLFDILYTILWLCETYSKNVGRIQKKDNQMFIVLIIDIIMCAFNFYGITCVVSQYQQYSENESLGTYPSNDKNSLPPIEFRLIKVQNSKSPQKDESKINFNEMIENKCLKVPKQCESSSGSSLVEDISEGSLLTTIDELKIDYKNSNSDTCPEFNLVVDSDSEKLFYKTSNNRTDSKYSQNKAINY